MDEAIVLFSCDAWHTHSSKDLVGVFTNKAAYKQYLSDMKDDKKLSTEDLKDMELYQQTQGRDMNYLIELHEINPKYEAE